MKVLLISQAYPPYPAVGALRARKLADALRGQGHDVRVITERLASDHAELRVDEPGLRVHAATVGLQYRLRVARLLQRLRGRGRAAPDAPGAAGDGANPSGAATAAGDAVLPDRRRRGYLARLALALLWLPDDEQRFIGPAYRLARRLMRAEPVDVIYTSAPSFSTHVVGLLLRWTTRTRWVVEFRDPWTDQRAGRFPDSPALIEGVHRWLEQRCLNAADRVVTVTEGARELLQSKVAPAERGKFVLARNGIDVLMPPVSRTPGPFRIVYAGTFYLERDPRPFLDALAEVCAARGLDAASLRVELVGHCRSYHGASVERMVAERGLEQVVHFRDWVPHDEAQALLRGADLLLFIALQQPLQVPNKLYDYLGARRPILAFVDGDGESAQMLRRVGGHHLVTEVTTANVAAALHAALDAADPERAQVGAGAVGDESVLRHWLAERQMGELVRAIGA